MSKLNYWFSQSCAVFVNFNFFIVFFFNSTTRSTAISVVSRSANSFCTMWYTMSPRKSDFQYADWLVKSVQSNLERFLQNSGTHPTTAGNNDYETYTSWNKMQPPSTDRNKKHISITSNNKSKFNLNSLEKLWVSLHAHERMQNL